MGVSIVRIKSAIFFQYKKTLMSGKKIALLIIWFPMADCWIQKNCPEAQRDEDGFNFCLNGTDQVVVCNMEIMQPSLNTDQFKTQMSIS